MSTIKTLSFVLAASTFALAGSGSAGVGLRDSSVILAQAGTGSPGGTSTPGMGGSTSGNPAPQDRDTGASGGKAGTAGGAGGAPGATSGSIGSGPVGSGSIGAVPAQCAAIVEALARQQCIERARTK